MVAPGDFLADYPEFAGIDPATDTATAIVARYLDNADSYLSNSAFGTLRDQAVELLTAHRLAIRYKVSSPTIRNPNVPGVLTSQSASGGGLSFGLAHSTAVTGDSAWRADLARTNYGLELLAMMESSIAPARLAGEDS
jgi:hypothetical protein